MSREARNSESWVVRYGKRIEMLERGELGMGVVAGVEKQEKKGNSCLGMCQKSREARKRGGELLLWVVATETGRKARKRRTRVGGYGKRVKKQGRGELGLGVVATDSETQGRKELGLWVVATDSETQGTEELGLRGCGN